MDNGIGKTESSSLNDSTHREHGAIATMEKNGHQEQCKEDENTSTEPVPFRWSKMPRRSQYTLVMCCLGVFYSGCQFYFIVPFFPREAEKKGVSETVIGVTFSVLHISVFVSSPFFGNFLPKIGAKFMYLGGAFVSGISTILFGLGDLCSPGAAFVVPTMMCRCLMALGMSAFITAGFAIITNEFPNNVATAFGTVEVANGIGLMVGPAVGGALYELGGFGLPFFIIGGLVILNGLGLTLGLPPPTDNPAPRKGSVLSLAKSSLLVVALFNFFIASIGISFLDPTIGKRLEMFDVSTAVIGLVLLCGPGLYALSAPFYGYLTDVKEIPTTLIMLGTSAIGIAYLLFGPCPGLDFLPSDIWIVVISVGMTGMGFGAVGIPTIKCMITGAVEIGFPNNLETYGMVSGLFFSGMCAGGFFGTTMGGILLDHYGYRFSSMVVSFIHFGTTVLSILYFGARREKRKQKEKEITQQPNLPLKDNAMSKSGKASQISYPDVTRVSTQ